jgi:vanillin dehydrogenase
MWPHRMVELFLATNPTTNEVVTRAAAATVTDAAAAADSAAGAFPAWSALGPGARRNKLLRAADILEQRIPTLRLSVQPQRGTGA